MTRLWTFISSCLFLSFSQAQDIQFNFEVTEEVEVCQEAVPFTLTAINNTGAVLVNPLFEIELPEGIVYVSGSLSETTAHAVAEYDVSESASLQFTASDLPVGDSVQFSISYLAKMPAVTFQLGGGVFRNTTSLTHDAGFEFGESESYNILYPALNVLNVTPASQTILSGDTTSRSFTVVNAGYGKTDLIYITDTFTSGASLAETSFGSISGDTIVLSGTDFEAIGNGDGFFDNNESITIVETIVGNSCSDLTSSSVIRAFWGCETMFDFSATSYAHVAVDFQSPSLTLITTEELNACFGAGVANRQQLAIVNKGSGNASALVLDLFKSSGAGYDESIFTRFDENSAVYRVGDEGTSVPLAPDATTATDGAGDYACLGPAPVGRMVFSLPDLAPNDTLYIEWDMYACCIDVCENRKVKGWEAEVTYADVCGLTTYEKSKVGQSPNSQLMSFFTETPTDIGNGETETYSFIVSSFENDLPENDYSGYEVVFSLDEGLVYESMSFVSNGVTWSPFTVDYDVALNQVIAVFPVPIPFTVPKSELLLGVSGSCGESGWKTIEMDVFYQPDSTCEGTCKIPLECDLEVSTYLHCPLLDCDGLRFIDFSVERSNFGLPDNDFNGLPDASGSLDMSLVKRNRAMVGDTLEVKAIGVVETSGAGWTFGRFTTTNDEGINLALIAARVEIYDASTGETHIALLADTDAALDGNGQTFGFNLSVDSLAATQPDLLGYVYSSGDSLCIITQYEVITSVDGLVKETLWENDFYLSAVAAPSPADKRQCDVRFARTTLIGYSWRNDFGNNNTVRSCTKKISQNWGLSIGDCCSNYSGGNLFPYEYRHWGYLKEAKVVIPNNYELVNTFFRQKSTRRTNVVTTQTKSSIVPDAVIGDTLYYNLEQYYESGDMRYSDDGFNGILQVELAPNCDVPQGVYEPVKWWFNYQKSDTWVAEETGFIDGPNDQVRFSPSNLTLSSTNPWADANTREVSWEVKVQNTASSDAQYAWLHLDVPENITITSIVNQATDEEVLLSTDIYQIGTINDGTTTRLTVNAEISNCDTVMFDAYTGYECTGYPADFASFTCNISQTLLYVEPKPSGFQVRLFTEPVIGDPCSQLVEVGLEVVSVKIAHMYDMEINLLVDDTSKINIMPDSSYFKYNIDNPYNSIGDPVWGGGIYPYEINNYESGFALQGIPGVLDLSNNRYRWKTTVALGETFEPGDYIGFQILGENACDVQLPAIRLDYDPNTKFVKDNTVGLHAFTGNSWSASWGDYDGDGFDDLFVPNKNKEEGSALYHNNGDGTMTRIYTGAVATDLGESVSGSWADYDNDGDLDLFVANNTYAKNRLYQNNGDGTFIAVADDPIIDEGTYSHSASWADYDNDGFLDMVVSDIHATHFNRLFRSNGVGGFELVVTSPISQEALSAVGVSWADYDNDRDLDLFIANTNGENNSLFRNDAGSFTAVTTGAVVTDGGHSIGGVWGDYDNDGDLDLFVTNARDVEPNFFYENNGDGTFTRILSGTVVSNQSHSHGASWIDYDNDGDLDLLVANDQAKKNFLFSNNGDKTFTKITNAITEEEGNAYGTAWADFDNDGDYDLLVANHGDVANDFFINEKGACNNFLGISLEGCNSNRSGIGARIKVKATIAGESVWQMREISAQTSALGGQNALKAIFGLYDATSVDSVVVLWPSGIVQVLTDQAVNQQLTINETCGVKLCGNVFFDANENGVQDAGENGIPGQQVVISPGDITVFTNNEGYFQVYVAEGTYDVSWLADENWVQVHPTAGTGYSINAVLGGASEYCGNDFGCTPVCTSADLAVQLGAAAFRRGLTNDVNVTVHNKGAYATAGPVNLELKMSETVYLVTDTWATLSEEEGYRTYTFSLDGLAPLSDTVLQLVDSVAASAILEESVEFEARLVYAADECDTVNNVATVFDIVVGSIDPNDKQVLVFNKGVTPVANRSDTLVYTIRFQNVGNYAARRVCIVDTLSPWLDWSSLELANTTHPFAVSVVNGVITWVNNAIELPDSTSDPQGSNGSVSFRILPKPDCPPFETVYNKAGIQFDYNDYLITNTTEINIGTGITNDENEVFIYPNPAVKTTEIVVANQNHQLLQLAHVEVLDLTGKRYWFDETGTKRSVIEVQNWPKGTYIVKALDEDQNYYWGKLIVQ